MRMRELFGWNQHFMHVRKEYLHRMSINIFNSGQDSDQNSDQDRNHTNVENLQFKLSFSRMRPVCYQKTCFLEVAAKEEREKSSTSQKRKHAYIFRVRRLLHAPKIVNIYR